MNFKVTYYDYDTNSTITKNCIKITYNTNDNNFSFIPVDEPPKIYKAVVIDHPTVNINQSENNIRIHVEGYQYVKNNGYWKTKTVIESV